MQSKSLHAAERINARAKAVGLTGTMLSPAEVSALETDLGLAIPTWLRQLWTRVPLCGVPLGLQMRPPEGDGDGVAFVEWATEPSIRSESFDLYPGSVIRTLGYINVAGNDGSGDPLFICIHDGDDPPLYRVFHDLTDADDVITGEGRELVAATLSDFFDSAIVRTA